MASSIPSRRRLWVAVAGSAKIKAEGGVPSVEAIGNYIQYTR